MEPGERPLVGIACGQFSTGNGTSRVGVNREYVQAIEGAGAVPVLLPLVESEELVEQLLGNLNGLLLAGGGDVDPMRFGEDPIPGLGEVDPERDDFELALVKAALQRDMPVLGICRGIQVLNVAAGGTLYQDIQCQVPRAIQHNQRAPRWYPSHEVRLDGDTLLASIYQADSLRVNSFHHQAVKVAAPVFRVSAKAKDAVVEGIESREHRFVVGVQWHPESMVDRYPAQRLLFAAFVKAARGYRPARANEARLKPAVVDGPPERTGATRSEAPSQAVDAGRADRLAPGRAGPGIGR